MYNEKIIRRFSLKMETMYRAKQEFAVPVPVSDLSGGRMGGSLSARPARTKAALLNMGWKDYGS
jgi:hypothetical protein